VKSVNIIETASMNAYRLNTLVRTFECFVVYHPAVDELNSKI